MMNNQKARKVILYLVLFGVFLMFALPNSAKEKLSINIYNISVCSFNFLYIPIVLFLIPYIKLNKSILIVSIIILFLLLSCLLSQDFIIQRFLISIQFFLPFLLFNALGIDKKDFVVILSFALILFIYVFLQIFLQSTGFIHLDTGDVVLMGEYIRRGSTIGPSTFTAPVFVILYGILVAVIKNNRVEILLSIILSIGVFLTGTRAALLVVLISFLFLFIFISFKRKIVILVVILFFAPYLDEKFNIYNTIQSRNIESSSVGGDLTAGRVLRWELTLDILKTDPELFFFGTGGANTPYFNRFRKTNIRSVASPHNVYLSFLFEHGIFGFLSFSFFILYLLKALPNKKSMSYYIFLLTMLIIFNTEVIPRTFEFSFILFLLYFICYKKSAMQ